MKGAITLEAILEAGGFFLERLICVLFMRLEFEEMNQFTITLVLYVLSNQSRRQMGVVAV